MYLTHLECPRCNATYEPDRLHNLCACKSPLLARYDLDTLADDVQRSDMERGRDDMWRFAAFLPAAESDIISLGEGMTPLYELDGLGGALGIESLMIKDEGYNPTGTFKARGASCGISMASRLGAECVAMPTAGNAGGAWSAYAARAGLDCVIAMPEDAPEITMKECVLYGAHTYLVRGLISDAGKLINNACEKYGWFDVSTLKEPYRIEGKKTMGLELAMQLGWRVPDVIVYPAGGGVGLIGIWKALDELQQVGWIGEERPRMVAVQAEGCAPLVEAFERGDTESNFWDNAETLAGGIRVPKALGDFLVLEAVYASDGCAVSVTEDAIVDTMRRVARVDGAFLCPEAAAAVAGVARMREDGDLESDEEVMIINTGSGLKYSDLVESDLPCIDKDEAILPPGE